MSVEKIKDKRGEKPGRRRLDNHVCVFHDNFKEQNLNCLIAIKDRIKIIEHKMEGVISIKIAGIITTVAMGFLILFIGAAFNMMQDVRKDIEKVHNMIDSVEEKSDNLLRQQAITTTKQQNILESINSINKELKKNGG